MTRPTTALPVLALALGAACEPPPDAGDDGTTAAPTAPPASCESAVAYD